MSRIRVRPFPAGLIDKPLATTSDLSTSTGSVCWPSIRFRQLAVSQAVELDVRRFVQKP
jgi:hypothetical protein